MKVHKKALNIKVYGLVQGVGFRPFIYSLASDLNLSGWALNRNDCVQIRVQGKQELLEKFLLELREQAPPLSKIESVISEETSLEKMTGFTILHSQSDSTEITRVSPDIAVCQDCLDDMQEQKNRLAYPFVNCTNCGPRFSLIQELPYDRVNTTMKVFTMCPQCQQEYEDIRNRRFHAQPNACRVCGPEYQLLYQGGHIKGIERILEMTCQLMRDGKILAIKGVGGFHLACDATNESTVSKLRQHKQREGKPFAVMFATLDTARDYAEIHASEAWSLLSWRRPIVLLKKSVTSQKREKDKILAPSVTLGLHTLGLMLPYTPFHYLLFERLERDAIVLTSGNISDEPIVITNKEAIERLSPVADALLIYNRDIHNRTDDSVVHVIHNTPRLLRRSRGWTPEPVSLKMNVEGIVATGAELKNCFCVGKGNQAILSQHIGDLKNAETFKFYQEAFDRFKRLFRVEPDLIACDLHPDYLSTRFAQQQGIPTVAVQHHHAHIASCMAEYGLDEPVIGVSFDGTGLGDDQKIWGGEFFLCDLNSYTRVSHFEYVPMPGGDKAAEEPWRMGISYLYHIFGIEFLKYNLPFLKRVGMGKLRILLAAIDRKLNSPLTSSVGRLFDAVAAVIDLVTESTFEAEAPIRLEALTEKTDELYSYRIKDTVLVDTLIKELVRDVKMNVPQGLIATKFHNTIVAIIVEVAGQIRAKNRISTVVLSGGVFQNKYLLEHTEQDLKEKKFIVYSNSTIPANDGGICLGQLAIAAKRRELGL